MTTQRDRLHEQVDLALTNRPLVDSSLESRLDTISADLRTAGHAIVDLCPPSRELSLALTHLQETRMFAVAAIALHQERIGRRTVEEILDNPDANPNVDSGELIPDEHRDDVPNGGQPF